MYVYVYIYIPLCIYPFWGEGYEHQQAFWVHLSKGYVNDVKGVCTSTPGLKRRIADPHV